MRWMWLVLVWCGCPEPEPKPDAGDSGGAADAPDASGEWTGDCVGTWFQTASTPSTYDVALPIVLDLTETDGDVTGTFAFAGATSIDPVALSGTRQGTALSLEAAESDVSLGFLFTLTLDGDEASGTWEAISDEVEVQPPLDCTLSR